MRYLPSFNRKASLVILMSALGLSACSSDISDLHQFVEEARTSQKPKVSPLPEIKPYETYSYSTSHLKDPFEPFVAERPTRTVTASGGKKKGGPKPVEGRAREALESYPLDVLRMVGVLEQNSVTWALLKGGDGTIHRVRTGNYIGQNHGKIIKIAEDKVSLVEIVPDGLGDWIERPASLALAGTPDKGK